MKTKMLKRTSALWLAALLAAPFMVKATPLTVGGDYYLGVIHQNVSGGPEDMDFINRLITLSAEELNILIPPENGDTYNRLGSTLAGPFPSAIATGFARDDSGNLSVETTGYSYVLAKYVAGQQAAGALVWFLDGNETNVTLPAKFNNDRKSQLLSVSFFQSERQPHHGDPVPETGLTVSLLAVAWAGLMAWRRRLA